MTNDGIKNKLQRGLALTVKESWDLYKYIQALEQQSMRDATEEERKSVKNYIESISKPTGVQFEAQPFINKPCISKGVCREDKIQVLDKIRSEIEKLNPVDYGSIYSYESHNGARDMKQDALQIIDKYRVESEGWE